MMTKQIAHTEPSWYAVHTKYKCEKHVVAALKKKGITAYTPTISTTKRYTRKVITRDIPLINCYVFVHVQQDQFVKVLQTEHVYSFLKIGKELNEVRPEEIQLLKRITGEYNDIELQESQPVEGDQVEIISGNLTGVKGVLVKIENKNSFLVELQSLSYQLKINVDPSKLRQIHRLEEIV